MRLINSQTLKLQYFAGEQGVPPYAILSHAWGDDEVNFQEMGGNQLLLRGRRAYQKIADCCTQAIKDNLKYVWIDTCCIDKSSSAELSEAINSMFRWYRQASVCYTYLADVSSIEDPALGRSKFRESRWFTRGWTLQELLAPREVVFFANDWHDIGTKHALHMIISEVTNIDKTSLLERTWDHVSIAGIMSWASKRRTTRVEDLAYCLMGIFQVNMPLIYGEGDKAFYRLQLEIMKHSNDESIFVWSPKNALDYSNNRVPLGLLAPSPAAFEGSGGISTPSALQGGGTAYDTEKQHIRLSTRIVRLCVLPAFSNARRNPKNMSLLGEVIALKPCMAPSQGIDEGRIIIPINDPGFENLDEKCLLAVLRCKDNDGFITIPVQKLPSGEFERFTTLGSPQYRVNWKPLCLVSKESNLKPGHRISYELTDSDSIVTDSVISKSNQTVLIRAQTRVQPEPVARSRFTGKQNIRIDTESFTTSGYGISFDYPAFFMVPNGGKLPSSDLITERLRKGMGIAELFVLFFQHQPPRDDHQPFAIFFERSKVLPDSEYQISCLSGLSVGAWDLKSRLSRESRTPVFPSMGTGYTEVPLARGKSLVFRIRKGPPGTPESVHIAIEMPLWGGGRRSVIP